MSTTPQALQSTTTNSSGDIAYGWYVGIFCASMVMLSGIEQIAPIVFGLTMVALIFQLQNLLQGK